MDSFELNKIIGAILGTLLFVMAVGFVAEGIYAPITGQGPGYNLPEPAAAGAAPVAAAPVVPLPVLLAKADPTAGQESAKKCLACHDFGQAGQNKIGPGLYGVVGRPIASHPGFQYSDALKKFAGQPWTYQLLNVWLTSPAHMAPGTKMTFVGIDDPEERANVLAYLRTLSPSPVPFPPVAAAAPAAATPAAGAAPAAAGGAAPIPASAAAAAPGAPATPAGTTPATAGATSTPSPAPTPAPGTTTTNTAPNATTAAPAATPAAQPATPAPAAPAAPAAALAP